MRLVSPKTKRILQESLQTFVIAALGFGLAILLTFVEDWCEMTHRPTWLTTGIQITSIVMFVCDMLVLFGICVRIMVSVAKETIESFREED